MAELDGIEEKGEAALRRAREAVAVAALAPGPAQASCAKILRDIDAALARLAAESTGMPKKDLLGVICHDLKDPLAAIVMGVGFLRRSLPQDDAAKGARRVVEAMRRASERMTHVIDDFHDLTKLEGGRLAVEHQTHEVEALVRAAAEPFAARAKEAGIALTIDAPASAGRVTCDRARVVQVFAKLLLNAVRFTPSGGTITLRAERRGPSAWFAVTDSGRGVPDAQKPTVFDREINATRTPRDGPGLGLAIARELVTLQGGEVGVRDNDGAPGVTFWFTLPSAEGA